MVKLLTIIVLIMAAWIGYRELTKQPTVPTVAHETRILDYRP